MRVEDRLRTNTAALGNAVETMVELLLRRAERDPDGRAYTFLTNRDEGAPSLTYGRLDREARAIAFRLQQAGVKGQPVLLAFQPGLQFITAFFGCLYAGAIATPAYPPSSERNTRRLLSIAADAKPRIGLTTRSLMTVTRRSSMNYFTSTGIAWLAIDDGQSTFEDELAEVWRPERIAPENIALLQYTSGSTATPKGVMISHANLLQNQRLIQQAFGQSEQSVIMSWLPLYHDMGLIGAVLHPLYIGAKCVLMSPVSFLQNPVRWLEAISTYRATTSGGPNFAFDLCARQVTAEQKRTLDLSSWAVAFNGAEPIQAETLDRFSVSFQECGFRRAAFRPCYGLAEATLLVSAETSGAPVILEADARGVERNRIEPPLSPATRRRLVSAGVPSMGQKVIIVNPDTHQPCSDGEVGEIWVSGPCVAEGYWDRPLETQKRLKATLTGDSASYLRTGDLGFLDRQALFIVGRLKDLIIIHGVNYHPLDIEVTAQKTHTALRPNCGAVFSIERDGDQKIVLTQEIDRAAFSIAESLIAGIRAAVATEHELAIDAIALVVPGSVPKTSSGKIRRADCRAQFLAGELKIVSLWEKARPETGENNGSPRSAMVEGTPKSAMEVLFAQIWGEVLETYPIGIHQNFFELGGDSISAAIITARIGKELGREIPLQALMDHPTVAELAAAVAHISSTTSGRPQLVRQRRKEASLSRAQERLWIDEQLRAGEPVYNVPLALHFYGELDLAALRASLDQILRRHEALRTRFVSVDREPRQLIEPELRLDVPLVDFSELAPEQAKARLEERLRSEAAVPFDLARAPLVRAFIVRLAPRRHTLSLTLHHLICDGWSAGVMLRELSALYPTLARGGCSPLPELPLQYADFASWQREVLQTDALESELDYWRRQLAEVPQSLLLPTDKPRPAVNLHRGERCQIRIAPELRRGLAELGRREGATLFMVVSAVFQVLLSRYSRQFEFLLGAPIANRGQLETQGLIGFLVNTLALRCDLRDDPPFRELVRRVRETTLEAHLHQNLPFERIVEELQPGRNLDRTPLFQVMLLVRPAEPVLDLDSVKIEMERIETGTAMYDLTLELIDSPEEMKGSLEYNRDLFERATAERMLRSLLELAQGAVEEPERVISRLPLLREDERLQELKQWNDTRRDYGPPSCLHELFTAQAERTPDAIAVSSAEGQISYRELHKRVTQLSSWLQNHGAGPESVVGVCLERSLEMVVALLGALEAGACYAPLDPSYPRERLSYMAQDAEINLILTRQALKADLGQEATALCLDTEWEQAADLAPQARKPVNPENSAYLIYTSGSTGKPKGVLNSHRGIVNRLRWMQEHYELKETDRFLQKTPFGFDVSVWEFFAPLITGACLVMATPEGHRDPAYLADLIADEQITIIHFIPAMLRPFLERAEAKRFRSVRQVICSGEALAFDLQERFFQVLNTRLDNLYGPTEAAVEVTAWRCRLQSQGGVPIGRPIGNLQIYILDRWGEVVPIGVTGELYIGGRGVARGYWKKPGLTAGCFVPDPYGGQAGGRLYRTGDLARRLPGGEIEFQGRIDDQVKVRGHRIELGEIVAVLGEHRAVKQAAVKAWEADGGEKRLVGYVVPDGGDAGELREYLKGRLPVYMTPSAIVFLPSLPLSPNGKIDSKALPEPEWGAGEAGTDYKAPQTVTQELMAGIWAEALRLERVGIRDNFFDLGGHSLLGTQVVSRAEAVFGVKVPLRRLFESSTVAGLAEFIEAERHQRPPSAENLPPPLPADRSTEVPLSHAQLRLWLLEQLESASNAYIIPAAVRLRGTLNTDALERAINEFVRRHEVLRTRFVTVSGKCTQVIDPPSWTSLDPLDLTATPADDREAAVARLIEKESRRVFDLENDSLFRVRLLRVEEGHHIVLVTMHHIVSDGWSIGILVRELRRLYEAFIQGSPSALPELPLQYVDYAVWQRNYLKSDTLRGQVEYWKSKLAGLLPLELRADPLPLSSAPDKAEMDSLELCDELSNRLREFSRREGVTLFMTILAALQSLLARHTGLEDIAVGTPVAGRTRPEWEGLVGFFVNTLVMRTDLAGNPTFRQLLGKVRETALGAYANQEVPFERLIEELHPSRNPGHQPFFNVFLNMLNTPEEAIELAGLKLDLIPSWPEHAKFDLTFYVKPSDSRIEFTLLYKAGKFHAATAHALLAQLEAILASAVENPDGRVWAMSLATDIMCDVLPGIASHEQSLERPIHELFEAQTTRTPSSTAIAGALRDYTYEEVDRYANRVANWLVSRGVRQGDFVAIGAQRTGALVCAIIGVLKAGAAFVIIDPYYPAARVEAMLLRVRPKAWIEVCGESLRANQETAQVLEKCQVRLRIDLPGEAPGGIPGELYAESDTKPPVLVDASFPAYVAFTSGTTGAPLAVLGTHAPVSHFVCWDIEHYGLTAKDRFSMLSGLPHDPLLREIFVPLAMGASIAAPKQEQMVGKNLTDWLRKSRISIAHLSPSLARYLYTDSVPAEGTLPNLRRVFFGGEALTGADLRQMRRIAPAAVLTNFYGATETPQAISQYTPSPAAFANNANQVPLGVGACDSQLLVLNRELKLAGVGELGEIYVRSSYLSSGYFEDRARTVERFLPDPFGGAVGGRIYRTGDRARYLYDGNIECLGRIDQQVKIYGHRVELGEIDAQLRSHPLVGNAAVLLRPTVKDVGRLAAYVVPVDGSPLSTEDLRNYLRQRLPDYMVPTTFTVLPALPLTPNGKINREALQELGQAEAPGEVDEPPLDEIETLLSSIWADVLGLKSIGRNQSFFRLGGHSLAATQVIARAREIFRIEIPVRNLFEMPTVSGLAKVIRAIRSGGEAPQRSPLQRVAKGAGVPLSFAQQRLWFIDQLEPGGHAYIIPAALRLQGELNKEALRSALIAITHRHETLRTRFISVDETPTQVIDAEPRIELRIVDLTGQPSARQREVRARSLINSERQRAFDLNQEHPFRALLIRLGQQEHILVLTIHHIVSDGWSMQVLLREVGSLYRAHCENRSLQLSELPVQYADYAIWQRETLQGEALQKQLTYWSEQLKGLEPLELQTDRMRPTVQTYRGAAESFTLTPFLTENLRRFSQREGSTLFMTLLAAFQILLAKYSGQTDIAVGVPIAGRRHSELEGLIGLFVNTIVLRTSLGCDPTLREILCRTRETALGAYAHQDLPFERIIEELQPARDPSRSPLFQVMFIFQQAGQGEEEISELTGSRVEVDVTSAKFDLTLSVLDSPTGMRGVIEYNPDLFNRDRIRRMMRHFKTALKVLLENPNQRFSTFVLLNHNERKRVLGKWNATQVEYPPGQNLTKLFETQAELISERVAFIEEDRLLTYGELNCRANRLARRLRQSGCREGVPVAICVRRSLDMMVGILAIVKAGGLYLPIDPKMPNDRIAFMLGDTSARVVLTESELAERVTQSGVEIIRLDLDWPEIEVYDHSNLGGEATGESALYLVYTSGSTGRPKGVVGTHGGTINRFRWMWDRFPFQDREVCCLKTSLSFVDSVWECFGPLLAGVPGVLIPDSTVNDADLLISYLGQRQVSRIVLVPSLLDSLLAHEPNLGAFLPALNVWVCSGEALSSTLAERFRDAVPTGQLINLYGCSEVAGDVTFHLVGPVRPSQQIPIGRPVSNTQIYVLDENMNPCGIGLQGEIYIGGAHLARGYWNRPDETAIRFLPNPFAAMPGQRLYKTGDLGRFIASGEVEYLGRIDDQVKVRGYRVESGEVESVLAQHPNVRTVKVLAIGDDPYDKKLVAYVALVEAGESALRHLQDYAAGFLPSYMLPSAYVQLERFLWLPNGKVDRRSLPAVARSHTLSANAAAAAPSTPDEAALVEIWRETLGLDRVGIHDNFFDLGGHSLALAQVRTRIESRLGWRVSLLELFTYPTISAFCEHLSHSEAADNLFEEARRRSALQQKAFQRRRRQELGAFLGQRGKPDWPVASIEE